MGIAIKGETSPPDSVALARAHPPAKTEGMGPSRPAWSSYGQPYPLGRWLDRPVTLEPPVRNGVIDRIEDRT